jgi:hypothetical protein
MPGLLRGVARTAVAAGTFTAVSNRVSRHQYNKWAEEDAAQQQQAYAQQPAYYQAPPSAAPAGGGEDDRIAQLKELANLKEQGILTDQEFAAEKAKILGS